MGEGVISKATGYTPAPKYSSHYFFCARFDHGHNFRLESLTFGCRGPQESFFPELVLMAALG